MLIELDILLFLGRSLAYEASVFLFCALILLVGGQNKTALKCAGIFLLFVLTQHVDPALSCQFLCFFRAFYCGCCPKGAARFHAGKNGWLPQQRSAHLWLPCGSAIFLQSAIVTTSVIFRCFPTISEEWSAIKNSHENAGNRI